MYGPIDYEVIIEQPIDSSEVEEIPEHVCLLQRSIYGIRQAVYIWGSLLIDTFIQWGFQKLTTDERVVYHSIDENFIIIVIVVDHLAFVSNAPCLLNESKSMLSVTFDMKLFGQLNTFIG